MRTGLGTGVSWESLCKTVHQDIQSQPSEDEGEVALLVLNCCSPASNHTTPHIRGAWLTGFARCVSWVASSVAFIYHVSCNKANSQSLANPRQMVRIFLIAFDSIESLFMADPWETCKLSPTLFDLSPAAVPSDVSWHSSQRHSFDKSIQAAIQLRADGSEG